MVRQFDIPNNGQTRMELLPKVGLNNLAMWRALTFFLKNVLKQYSNRLSGLCKLRLLLDDQPRQKHIYHY